MRAGLLIRSTVFVAVLALGTAVFAQHGPPGGGGAGRPAGAGPGTVGRPSSVGPNDVGGPNSNVGAQSPGTLLKNNGKLNSALTNALAKSGVSVPGGDLQSACAGFKNLGQCVAALHVAKNLDIPGGFDALRDKMTGTNAVSLGKAIQQLDPKVSAKAESKKASKQANKDIKAAESES